MRTLVVVSDSGNVLLRSKVFFLKEEVIFGTAFLSILSLGFQHNKITLLFYSYSGINLNLYLILIEPKKLLV